jgi:hypothetical protein
MSTVFEHSAPLVDHLVCVYIYIQTLARIYEGQSAMQLHVLLVYSPLSPCFRVNSRHVSATTVYMMICVNSYIIL